MMCTLENRDDSDAFYESEIHKDEKTFCTTELGKVCKKANKNN